MSLYLRSLGLVYLPTNFKQLNVDKYNIPYMDPMGTGSSIWKIWLAWRIFKNDHIH